MNEQDITLPSLMNQDWKKCPVEIKKVNKSLQHIPTENITELNEWISSGPKIISDRIVIP